MNRVERIRKRIDEVVKTQEDEHLRRCGFVHLYGVSAMCAFFAKKRGLDEEICTTAGMLHDIWTFKTGDWDNHTEMGAAEAEKILRESGGYDEEEIKIICRAVSNHRDKNGVHDEISEVVKDADALQHYLYNTSLPVRDFEAARLSRLLEELRME